jgi:hypothetical protein
VGAGGLQAAAGLAPLELHARGRDAAWLDSDASLTMPADFGSFKSSSTSSARSARPSTTRWRISPRSIRRHGDRPADRAGRRDALDRAGDLGRVRYQLYPMGAASALTAVYHRQGARLIDGGVFTGVLADGAEVLVAGALAQAALWPDRRSLNPHFQRGARADETNEFKYGVQMLSLRDDEQVPDDLWDSGGGVRVPLRR